MAVDCCPRVPYAADPAKSRGRLFAEPFNPARSPFRRDCDRIIHATAFRRLKHKTQVFVAHFGDHFRTRLTHTLEVAQIARSLARALGLDEDLAEALALAHDLGHPPFGHAGERALGDCLKDFGGFDHNAQTLRIVTELERRYPEFDGLNLTWETLEGLVKHNGPLVDADGAPLGRYRENGIPRAIQAFSAAWNLDLSSHPSLEAQVAALADDIAYDAHDIDDGLRAGLFELGDLAAVPAIASILADIRARYPALESGRMVHELVRRLISKLIEDVIAETGRRLAAAAPGSADDVRRHGAPLAAFSSDFAAADRAIKQFLWPRMYRHPQIACIMDDAEAVVRDLFRHYSTHPRDMPDEWGEGLAADDAGAIACRVADFIAGMTDRYALGEHERFFPTTPDLR